MKNLLITVLTALAVLFAVSACKETSTPGEESTLKVTSLKCENLTDPLAIDSASPHFSYKLISSIDGDCQTAHEIQVASSRRKLESGKADFWKSGKVLSDSQVMILVEGPLMGLQGHSLGMVGTGHVRHRFHRRHEWQIPACRRRGPESGLPQESVRTEVKRYLCYRQFSRLPRTLRQRGKGIRPGHGTGSEPVQQKVPVGDI